MKTSHPLAAELAAGTDPFQQLLRQPVEPALPPPFAVVIGTVVSCSPAQGPCVQWPAGPEQPACAASLIPLTAQDVGRSVALSFPGGLAQPLILGVVWPAGASHGQPAPWVAEVDGAPVEIEAQKALTLRCGEASITLTADGQVLIRGHYISSHATGTQRIKGAAVRIN